MLKKTLILLVVVFIAIQFIRPPQNSGSAAASASIENIMPVPQDIRLLLEKACFDCHSNRTKYPWYVNIQPVAWFMADHIKEGKAELNFDEFGLYSKRRQASKLQFIANSLKDGSMPIDSYTWMHKDAKLSDNSKNKIIAWALQQKNRLEDRP